MGVLHLKEGGFTALVGLAELGEIFFGERETFLTVAGVVGDVAETRMDTWF